MKTNKILILVIVIFSVIGIRAQTSNPTFNSVGISTSVLTSPLTVGEFHGVKLSVGGTTWASNKILYTSWISGIGDFTEINVVGKYVNNASVRLIENGNVGIGVDNPDSKLTVAGNIHAMGDQNIAGSVGISTSVLTSPLTVGEFHGVKLSVGGTTWASNKILYTGWISGIGDFTEINVVGKYANNASIRLIENGNVGIGTTKPDSKLTVAGNIHAQEVKVTVNAGADFVFENDYNLPSLDSVDKFIKKHNHLPEIASAEVMKKEGLNLSEMNIKLLQKVEEMTLYMIEQNKQIIDLKSRLEKVETGSK